MDQTIRVNGEKEIEVRAKLSIVEDELKQKIKTIWSIDYPLYNEIFFVVFTQKDRLGEFDTNQRIILLSEDLIYQDFSVLRNVFLHEAAHALDYDINGYSDYVHSPSFRNFCSLLGVEEGFDKAKIKNKLKEDDEIREKMKKLMALTSSPFENEAMIALSKARKLLLNNTELLEQKEKKEDKIYYVTLYESGRVLYYVTRIAQFVGKATGVYILKVLGTNNGTSIKAYGSLKEVEAALYLFGDLLSSLDKEIRKLRKKGYRVTRDSFVIGACPEMEKKLRTEDTSSDNALIALQNENREKAHRLCFQNCSFKTTYSRRTIDPTSESLGEKYGKNMDFSSHIGRKEIKD